MVHLLIVDKLIPQVVENTAKSPVVEMTKLLSGKAESLAKANVMAVLVVPTFWLGKVVLAGSSMGGAAPVPIKAAVCGLFAAESVTTKVALSAPGLEGVNVTVIVHRCRALSAAGQVLVWE